MSSNIQILLGELGGSGVRFIFANSKEEAKKSLIGVGEGLTMVTLFAAGPYGFVKGFGKGILQGWQKGMATAPKP